MKTLYPEYFKQFKCIASECPDTCCAGWEIVVDESSIKKYKSLDSEIGRKIRTKMTTDSDGDIIFKNENGRCPFLTGSNLCEIYADAGKEFLCRTCAMFPRFEECFGSVRETGLGLACPEAAKIIIGYNGKFSLLSESDDEPPVPNEIDAENYFDLLKIRKEIFTILDDENLGVKERLIKILRTYQKDDNKTDIKNPFDLLEGLEFLTNDLKMLIADSGNLKVTDYTAAYKNIAEYFIYRYFLKSVFDGDYLTKLKFCVFSCTVISRAADALGVLRAVQLYSKEIEYNSFNMEQVYKRLKSTGVENIINFL
ncbi:MAG: flagellin lysine-N-methylase, partial [Clostridia bacterium]|nr:flagellin lysine-N-methylase [Clostridia bacterium]